MLGRLCRELGPGGGGLAGWDSERGGCSAELRMEDGGNLGSDGSLLPPAENLGQGRL